MLKYVFVLQNRMPEHRSGTLQTTGMESKVTDAGIFKQSKGGQEPSRNRVVVPARRTTQAGGIDSLESILGLLKSLKIRALDPDDSSSG